MWGGEGKVERRDRGYGFLGRKKRLWGGEREDGRKRRKQGRGANHQCRRDYCSMGDNSESA